MQLDSWSRRWRVQVPVAGLVLLFSLTGCVGKGILGGQIFRERAQEKPIPNEQNIDKSFFRDASGKPKPFLCAMAPEVGRGFYGERMNIPGSNQNMHCNVEWEITENWLIGLKINPSFINDRSRWTEYIRIPIVKHFYYEKAKDEYGREQSEWIENDSRSHYSARPQMRLNLSGLQMGGLASGESVNPNDISAPTLSHVKNVEWDLARGFLGFSFSTTEMGVLYGRPLSNQVEYRVNFLKFEHDRTFQKRPYAAENSRFMNVLHVVGKSVDGYQPELHAAHWDLRKPIRLYISKAPKEVQQTIVNAVYKWNREFQKIGAVAKNHQAFVPVVHDLKYNFDLRYPSITWFSDKRISMNAPLGMGMAHADVRNGKILWGGIVMFGGMLERMINFYSVNDQSSSSSDGMSSISPIKAMLNLLPENIQMLPELLHINPSTRLQMRHAVTEDHSRFLKQQIEMLSNSSEVSAEKEQQLNTLKETLTRLSADNSAIDPIISDLIEAVRNENKTVAEFAAEIAQQQEEAAEHAKSLKEAAMQAGNSAIAQALGNADSDKGLKELHSSHLNNSAFFHEEEFTFANKMEGWSSAAAQRRLTYPQMMQTLVMNLTLHELGHFLGLGHQFKENILPEPGTVPESYRKPLVAKATAAHEYGNYTSIMGYMHGRTEMQMPVQDVNPGPQDTLVLRYLYKGEYAAYATGDADFTYVKVPASGLIPDQTQQPGGTKTKARSLRTAYFPNCNDYEASLGADPFCNRFDRGTTATQIVGSYFDSINDSLLRSLYSLVGGGSDPVRTENYLWHRSFQTFSRVRMFYDEMRRRLRSDPDLKGHWERLRNDKDALFEFSTACQLSEPTGSEVKSEILRELFANASIVDLCRANAVAMREFNFFLNLPDADYTKIDHNNRYVMGGFLAGDAIRRGGNQYGTWYQLSNLPLKLASLYTLTSANSYLVLGGIWTNPYYNTPENRFTYRTLYPIEVTKTISDTVQSNLRFAASGQDSSTKMGQVVLATGGLLRRQQATSNDSARLPREYNELLDQQTRFSLGMVAVFIEAISNDDTTTAANPASTPGGAGATAGGAATTGGSSDNNSATTGGDSVAAKDQADRYKKFSASVYDFVTGKSSNAREVYILPKGEVIVWANGMFLYPITKLKFYGGTKSYVLAYKVSYDDGINDPLSNFSLKKSLLDRHDEIARTCISGYRESGLMHFFEQRNPNFNGFRILNGIDVEKGNEKLTLFYDSIDQEFAKYEAAQRTKLQSLPLKSMARICDEAIRGIGQISAAAALINGRWLGITSDYLEK